MHIEIPPQLRGAYAAAYAHLRAGETLQVERDAMLAMSDGVQVQAGIGSGGVVRAGLRKAFGGQTFFTGNYTAEVDGAWVAVAPRMPGDVIDLELRPGRPGLRLTQGAFIAADMRVNVDASWGGARKVLLQEGVTVLQATGQGHLLFGSYGGVQRYELAQGQHLVVDAGHIVAWSDTMTPQVGMLDSVTTAAVTGQWLVARFAGPGVVYAQTRAETHLRNWLFPQQKQRRRHYRERGR